MTPPATGTVNTSYPSTDCAKNAIVFPSGLSFGNASTEYEAETLAAAPPSTEPTQMFPSETKTSVSPTRLGYRKYPISSSPLPLVSGFRSGDVRLRSSCV